MTANDGWQFALRNCLNNPEEVVISSPEAVVIRDKFPKSTFHFLVLPRAEIENVFALQYSHLPLLDGMYDLAIKVIARETQLDPDDFLIGFKMDPLMKLLNMHVISADFVSVGLKTKRHWTNFHTRVFLAFKIAYGTLKIKGVISPLTPEELLIERNRPLACNQCLFATTSMFTLKTHLLVHWQEKQQRNRSSEVPASSVVQNGNARLPPQEAPSTLSSSLTTSNPSTIAQLTDAKQTKIQDSQELQSQDSPKAFPSMPSSSVINTSPSLMVRLMEQAKQKQATVEENYEVPPQEVQKALPPTSAASSINSTPSMMVRLMEMAKQTTIQNTPAEKTKQHTPAEKTKQATPAEKTTQTTSSSSVKVLTLDELSQVLKEVQLFSKPPIEDCPEQIELKRRFEEAKAKQDAAKGRWSKPHQPSEPHILDQSVAPKPEQQNNPFNLQTAVTQNGTPTWKNPFKQPPPKLENDARTNYFQPRNSFKANGKNHYPTNHFKPNGNNHYPTNSFNHSGNNQYPARTNSGDVGRPNFKPKQPYRENARSIARARATSTNRTISAADKTRTTTMTEPRSFSVQRASNKYQKSYQKPNRPPPNNAAPHTSTNGMPRSPYGNNQFHNKNNSWKPQNVPTKFAHQM